MRTRILSRRQLVHFIDGQTAPVRVQRHLRFAVAVATAASALTVSAGTAVAASSTSATTVPPVVNSNTLPTETPAAPTEDYTRPDVASAQLAARLLNHG
jgi:hypothetical protein